MRLVDESKNYTKVHVCAEIEQSPTAVWFKTTAQFPKTRRSSDQRSESIDAVPLHYGQMYGVAHGESMVMPIDSGIAVKNSCKTPASVTMRRRLLTNLSSNRVRSAKIQELFPRNTRIL
jgi:hypothetical protein